MNYYIYILGCQYNYYDAKRITHLLEKMGYVLSAEKDSDLIIVLSCSVRQKGMDRIFGKIKNWKKLPQKPKIIISACVLVDDKKRLIDKVDAIIDSKDIVKWLNGYMAKNPIVNNNLTIQPFKNTQGRQFNNVFLPRAESKNTAYIPIMQGCDNFCTYCAVPYTRGREVSRSEKEILDEIKSEISKGYNKIVLLGQNVNSWNNQPLAISYLQLDLDQKANDQWPTANSKLPFSKLLSKVDHLPYDFTFNFMSSNPHDFTDDLVDTLSKLNKWERELHLPLQSGDDEILKKMNRKYSSQQYFSLIENCKLKIENLSVTTDIIVGFPGETKAQFNNTVKLCKKIGFSKVYVSQYSPRPQTVSAKTMVDDVSKEEKKRRWTILNNLINKKTTL